MIWPLLLLAATPSEQALDYARVIAAHGVLASIGPMIASREIEELVAAHPELSDAEKARVRAMGKEIAERQGAALIEAEAQVFAAELSLEDLRELARAARSEAAHHMRQRLPRVMARTMATLAGINFDGDLRKGFCAETGKLCVK